MLEETRFRLSLNVTCPSVLVIAPSLICRIWILDHIIWRRGSALWECTFYIEERGILIRYWIWTLKINPVFHLEQGRGNHTWHLFWFLFVCLFCVFIFLCLSLSVSMVVLIKWEMRVTKKASGGFYMTWSEIKAEQLWVISSPLSDWNQPEPGFWWQGIVPESWSKYLLNSAVTEVHGVFYISLHGLCFDYWMNNLLAP